MPRSPHFLLVFALACVGSRFWLLRTSTRLPPPISTECVRASLQSLPNVASVRVERRVPSPAQADTIASILDFGIVTRGPYGGWVTSHMRSDSIMTVTTSWMVAGGRPPRDSIDFHRRIQATILSAISHDCTRL